MPDKIYDIAVIGGGPSGYIAAAQASELGASVILFESDKLGGTCLNYGCIPTKSYLKTAEILKNMYLSEDRGISFDKNSLKIDLLKIYDEKEKTTKTLREGVYKILESRDVKIINGFETLIDKNKINNRKKNYKAKKIILCTGAKPKTLPDIEVINAKLLNSNDILELTKLPESLAVIGTGIISMELACAFSAFGSKVTVIGRKNRILSHFDASVSEYIKSSLKDSGINFILGQKILKITGKDDVNEILFENGEKLVASKILVAIGREPNLEFLGELKDKIETENNFIKTDEYLRTNIPNIYACGDLTTKEAFAHFASYMGTVAAKNAMGENIKCRFNNIPKCLYTLPEAAFIGLSEIQAKNIYGDDIICGKFPFSANGRALAAGENTGFVKVICEKKYGEILGVHIAGPNASELISQAKILMDTEITFEEAKEIIFPHPTFSEAFSESLKDVAGECLNLPSKRSSK